MDVIKYNFKVKSNNCYIEKLPNPGWVPEVPKFTLSESAVLHAYILNSYLIDKCIFIK